MALGRSCLLQKIRTQALRRDSSLRKEVSKNARTLKNILHETLELSLGISNTSPVIGIDNKNDTIGIVIIVAPETTDLGVVSKKVKEL